MTDRRILRWLPVSIATIGLTTGLLTDAASAHSLDSSTISVRVDDDGVDATISLAIDTLDEALGADHTTIDADDYADQIVAYLDEHLTVTGADGTIWAETYSDAVEETIEGIDSFSVDVAFDVGSSDPADFTITYDAVIEAVDGHEAVVVLTDADGEISTPGVLDASDDTLEIGTGSAGVAVDDMVTYGFHHVLEGADHLLFLITLLLPAPFIVAAGRWHRQLGIRPALRKAVHVVTAFTVGHSLTLIASALGWITPPSRPVEVLIAASVAVSAVHAMRPFAVRGEEVIAVGFGLVHGLAFAGILRDLGLGGSTSMLALLSFNIGVELAQLVTAILVLPSIYVISRTRFAHGFRVAGASVTLAAAAGWIVDRLGVAGNPFAGIEDAAIGHPWVVVVGLAMLGGLARITDRSQGAPLRTTPTPS